MQPLRNCFSFAGLGLVLGLAVGLSQNTPSQNTPPHNSLPPLDAKMREAVIHGAIAKLNDSYVFPETATKMEAAVLARLAKGEYDNITNPDEFARLLTDHFREISKDKHLGVRYSPRPLPEMGEHHTPTAEEQEAERKEFARINYGFERVERLPGNIGYVDFRFFLPKASAGPTIAAAFNFLGNVDALIIDLRKNGGGDPETVALMISYLYDGQKVHLNDLWNRKTGKLTEFWTSPSVPGLRLGGKEIWVLTSNYTFSGAEEFAYNLKNLKRATLVGETTGGGAHPVRPERINDHFFIGVPYERAINPITKTNWEGVGVEPDVKTSAAESLPTAHLAALRKLMDKADPRLRMGYEREIARLENELAAMRKK